MMLQAFHNYFRKKETQLHELNYLFWECTQRCNLNCQHCGSDCLASSRYKDMPFEKMSLATYAGNAFSESWSFVYFRVPTEYCFHEDPRKNWIENRAVFDDEDVFLAYESAKDKCHRIDFYDAMINEGVPGIKGFPSPDGNYVYAIVNIKANSTGWTNTFIIYRIT